MCHFAVVVAAALIICFSVPPKEQELMTDERWCPQYCVSVAGSAVIVTKMMLAARCAVSSEAEAVAVVVMTETVGSNLCASLCSS